MSYAIAIPLTKLAVGKLFKVADYVSKSTDPEAPERIYHHQEIMSTGLWIEESWLEYLHSNSSLSTIPFHGRVGLQLALPAVVKRHYKWLGHVTLSCREDGIWATVDLLCEQWSELVKVALEGFVFSAAPMGAARMEGLGNSQVITKIFGVELVVRPPSLPELLNRVTERNEQLAVEKDQRMADAMRPHKLEVEFEQAPCESGLGEKWAITKVQQVPVPTLRPLDKFNYGRVSMLAHVRSDALRVDRGGPGRNAYMGSKEAIVRALVDYRGAKLYVFNYTAECPDADFLECVKLASLERIKDIEIWNNLRVTMVNDRLHFDGKRNSVKLHHEVESEEFAGRFTKHWFDANYKDIYGFHSKSIDRGTVRELRRAHGTGQAEATEGPGYNGSGT